MANFISPAFDFSNVNPKRISWRTGGMIAAVGSVLLTPWNWYNNDDAIHYTLGILGALIGPLFGILIAGYYIGSKQRVWVDDMFTMDTNGPLLVQERLQPQRGGRHLDRRPAGHHLGRAAEAAVRPGRGADRRDLDRLVQLVRRLRAGLRAPSSCSSAATR